MSYTDEQIERAAKVLYDSDPDFLEWDEIGAENRSWWCGVARTVLEAAGVVPLAPSADRKALAARLTGDILDAVPDDNDMQHILELAAGALAAPPPVDEAKLAEVIKKAVDDTEVDELVTQRSADLLVSDILARVHEWIESQR